jgi:nitroreductase
MEKPAETQSPVHDLIRRRWSPRAFTGQTVSADDLRSLLEAARWAPSNSNEQPWFYIVAPRENPEEFERMLSCLVESNQRWAKQAPLLMISVARLDFEKNGQPNPHAFHDVGQASAQLSLEAVSRGLMAHQMAGILPDKIREIYGLPEGFESVAGFAVGYPGDAHWLPEDLEKREVAPRRRKPPESFVFSASGGEPRRSQRRRHNRLRRVPPNGQRQRSPFLAYAAPKTARDCVYNRGRTMPCWA